MLLWGVVFLLLLSAPLALFGVWAVKRWHWPLRRLVPYNAVYGGGIGLLLGWMAGLSGGDLVVAAFIGIACPVVSTLSWARALDTPSGHNEARTER